ncbi:MAG: hypothetical protein HY720_19355 [Planctomycetes bacterium]|nr:hypothetical protein [Planctomycetota bacterium]
MALIDFEFLWRHGEKVLFYLAASIAAATVVAKVLPDQEIESLRRRHGEALRGIEREIERGRIEALEQRRNPPALAARTAARWQPVQPVPIGGDLSGLAFYLPALVRVIESAGAPSPTQPPPPPAGLQVAKLSPDRVEIRWEPVPGATRYRVVRRLPGDGGEERTWTVTDPALQDAEVMGGARYRYAVFSIKPVEPSAVLESPQSSDPIEVEIPEPFAVEFGGYQEGQGGTATFHVRRHVDGLWYSHTFYLVRRGDRIGLEIGPGGFPTFVESFPEGGGDPRRLDMTTPWEFADVASERVPLLMPRKEYLIRYGPGPDDTTWSPSLSEFNKEHPEHSATAQLDRAPDGSFVTRVVLAPVSNYTRLKYRVLLRDIRRPGPEGECWLEETGEP